MISLQGGVMCSCGNDTSSMHIGEMDLIAISVDNNEAGEFPIPVDYITAHNTN